MSKIAVLGAGNYGTTLANLIANKGHKVNLWTIEKDVYNDIKNKMENKKYLPGVKLSDKIEAYIDLRESLNNIDIIVIAVPSHVVRELVVQVAPIIKDFKEKIIVDIAKGLEDNTFFRMSEIIKEVLEKNSAGHHHIVALSGPSIAKELAQGVPTSVMVAAEKKEYAKKAKETFETDIFKICISNDIVGLELGGVFKNIIALVIGMCDGAGFGLNTKSALMVAFIEEIVRLGVSLGAHKSTFYGLAGLGDIIATSMSSDSRNHSLGFELGQGKSLKEALDKMFMVTEGVAATKAACLIAKKMNINIPLINKVNDILDGKLSIIELINYYMSKDIELS